MIQFLDLKKINPLFEAGFQQKLKLVLQKGWYILRSEVTAFESNFADYCAAKNCVGVGNGFDALLLSFKGYIQLGKLNKGDEVIVSSNTYITSILAIFAAELIPVLVEPRLETYNLNPDLIQDKITPKSKEISAVHLCGQLAEMDLISAIAIENNLLVIECAAQAHGAIKNQKSAIKNQQSSIAYSFYPGKNLGAFGDGGAVVTNDTELAKVIQSLRNYGSEVKYKNEYILVNSRLDELQATFLNVKLPHLDQENNRRRTIAERYLFEIKNDKIIVPFWDLSTKQVFHLFVIRTEKSAELQAYLLENGIQTMIHYPVPPPKQKAFCNWSNLPFSITEKVHNVVLSLPISPVLTEEEVDFVIQTLNNY